MLLFLLTIFVPYPSLRKILQHLEPTSHDRTLQPTFAVLQEVLAVFGKAIEESLTRTMGQYLEVTGGQLANTNKSNWDKDIAARMVCTNNHAEGPFATVRAFLHMYPRSTQS